MALPGVKRWKARKRRQRVSHAVDTTFNTTETVLDAIFWIGLIIVDD